MPRGAATRFGLAVGLAAMALSWTLVARTLANPSPVQRSTAGATAVVWGGLVFTHERPLRRWLHARGVAYPIWEGRHLRAAATLAARS